MYQKYHKVLKEVAENYGTPTYVYFEESFNSQLKNLKEALKNQKHLICYAVKANSNLSILRRFSDLGTGFDIVSAGELARVLKAGAKPARVVFSGVGKTAQEIKFALEQGIKLFNVESEGELELLNRLAVSSGKRANVALRVNPNIAVDTHPYISTGMRSSKFGIALEEVERIGQRAHQLEGLQFLGLDCHIGSQLSDIALLQQAYSQILALANKLRTLGIPIKILDFGGGLGVSFSGHSQSINLPKYGQMLDQLLAGQDYEVIVEPGRFLIGEAGVLLTRVQYRKSNNEHSFVVVDAGMNDLIRPALYQAFHHIEVICDRAAESEELVDVVGPVCESACFFAKQRKLPKTEAGDLLGVFDAGAYGFCMSSNYNSRPFAAEVLVQKEGRIELIRRRQSYEDLWSEELF